MGSEWQKQCIGELPIHIGDGNYSSKYPKASEFVDKGVPFISASDFSNGVISNQNLRFISEQQHSTLLKGHLKSGDVLVVTRGNGTGDVAWVEPEYAECNINAQLVLLRADEKVLHNRFLYFLLSSSEYKETLVRFSSGSAQPQLPIKALKLVEIFFPPYERQIRIAEILASIDNKITLNRQLNQTLEQMAQALFKSWFVDFDPVIDNALAAGNVIPEDLQDRAERRQLQLAKADHKPLPENIRKLFPSEFELTESLGWVPKGWKCKTFADVTVELRRGISPKYIESDGILVLNQKCIRDHDVNFSIGRRHDSISKSIDGRSLKLGDVLVNSTGVGTLGRVAQIKYLPEDAVVDSHVTVVRSNPEIYPAYTFAQQIIAMESEIEAMGEGSTGQTELSRKVLSEKSVLIPSLEVLKISEEYFIGFAMKSAANIQSTEKLATLRDTLLPKLISGELRIPEAQAQFEEALG